MAKIKTLTEKSVKSLLKKFNAVYSDFAKEHGLEASQAARALADTKLGTISVAIKFSLPILDKDGKVVGAPAKNWKDYAETFGLKPEWLGRKIRSKGVELTIIGLNPRKRQKPVMLVSAEGDKHIAAAEPVIAYLTKADEARAAKKAGYYDKDAKTKRKESKAQDRKKLAEVEKKVFKGKHTTLAQGVKIVPETFYAMPDGGGVALDTIQDGRTTLWVIRIQKKGSTTSNVFASYGKSTGVGATERRRFAEKQMRKLVAGLKGVKKKLPAEYEA